MALSLYEAVEDIREAAAEYRLPGPRKKLLWATIVSQVAKRDSCDGALVDYLLEIIREYLKKPTDEDIISIWLETETGFADNPEELYPDCVRIDLQEEILAEVTALAWEEADEVKPRKKKRR